MEQAYRRGRIIDKNGKKELYFEPSNTANIMAFNKSLEQVVSIISCYDFKKIKNTDCYYIYKTTESGGKIDPKEIEENIKDTIESIKEDEDTI